MSEVMFSNVLLCLTSSPEPQNIQFLIKQGEKKLQIFMFGELEQGHAWYICLKNDRNH